MSVPGWGLNVTVPKGQLEGFLLLSNQHEWRSTNPFFEVGKDLT